MGRQVGQVCFKGDIHRAADIHFAFHRQIDIRSHFGARTISTNQVLGANGIFLTGQTVEYLHADTLIVLGVA